MIMILLVLSLVYLVLTVISILSSFDSYKYYKKTYNLIKNKEYILYSKDSKNRYITFTEKGEETYYLNNITYDKDDKSIKIIGDEYIFFDFFILFDLYTLYWYNKIKKEIIFNSMSIAEKRNYKLKEIGI